MAEVKVLRLLKERLEIRLRYNVSAACPPLRLRGLNSKVFVGTRMKLFWKALIVANLNLVASTVWASDGAKARRALPDETLLVRDHKTVDPVLQQQSQASLMGSCPSSGVVAFSVAGDHHVSSGGLTLLGYQGTYESIGGGWISGGGTFIAPCKGLYFFTVSFVKDTYSYGGTTNDVWVYITHNGFGKGYAWSGQGAGNRDTGTYSLALVLQAGDYVQTFVNSDGSGATRHLARYNFTGHLVRMY